MTEEIRSRGRFPSLRLSSPPPVSPSPHLPCLSYRITLLFSGINRPRFIFLPYFVLIFTSQSALLTLRRNWKQRKISPWVECMVGGRGSGRNGPFYDVFYQSVWALWIISTVLSHPRMNRNKEQQEWSSRSALLLQQKKKKKKSTTSGSEEVRLHQTSFVWCSPQ